MTPPLSKLPLSQEAPAPGFPSLGASGGDGDGAQGVCSWSIGGWLRNLGTGLGSPWLGHSPQQPPLVFRAREWDRGHGHSHMSACSCGAFSFGRKRKVFVHRGKVLAAFAHFLWQNRSIKMKVKKKGGLHGGGIDTSSAPQDGKNPLGRCEFLTSPPATALGKKILIWGGNRASAAVHNRAPGAHARTRLAHACARTRAAPRRGSPAGAAAPGDGGASGISMQTRREQ